MRGGPRLFLILSTSIVVLCLVAGFVIIPSPALQRLYNLDSKRSDSLDTLAAAVNVFVVAHGALPATLDALTTDVKWSADAVRDPATGAQYEYIEGRDFAYQLCATFGAQAQKGATGFSWHPEGHYCEQRRAINRPRA